MSKDYTDFDKFYKEPVKLKPVKRRNYYKPIGIITIICVIILCVI